MIRKKPSRIAYAAVDGGKDYQGQARHDERGRLKVLADTIRALRGEKLDLLTFPAGFLQVRNRAARLGLGRRIKKLLDDIAPSFGVIVGVDEPITPAGGSKAPSRKSAASAVHPFFALYRSAAGKLTWMQQVSVTRNEGANRELVEARWANRALVLPRTQIAFLICGEIWSDELLDRVAASGCRTLVVAAHRNVNLHREATGYGKLSWHRRLAAFSRRNRLPVVLAEHTRSPQRHRYAWPGTTSALVTVAGVPAGVTLRIGSSGRRRRTAA